MGDGALPVDAYEDLGGVIVVAAVVVVVAVAAERTARAGEVVHMMCGRQWSHISTVLLLASF